MSGYGGACEPQESNRTFVSGGISAFMKSVQPQRSYSHKAVSAIKNKKDVVPAKTLGIRRLCLFTAAAKSSHHCVHSAYVDFLFKPNKQFVKLFYMVGTGTLFNIQDTIT